MSENNKDKSPKVLLIFGLAFATFIVATYAWTLSRGTDWQTPPSVSNIDGVFYDNIAFNLNKGKGFVVDFDDVKWSDKYRRANDLQPTIDQYDWVLRYQGTGPTTLRSPGYPVLLSAVYRIFDHDWRMARLIGCVLVSFGLAILVTWCCVEWGYLAALIASTTMILDYSIMHSAGMLASEGLAILLLAVAFLLAVRAWTKPGYLAWALCGIAFAVLVLTRGSWNLGLLIMLAGSLSLLLPAVRRRIEPVKTTHLLTFFAVVILIAAPWWIRNCNTTGHFQPFGTAGSIGSVAAYCDESLADYGQWQPDVYATHQNEVFAKIDVSETPLADREYLMSQESIKKASQWTREHWQRLPELMGLRALSHWGFFNPSVPNWMQAANIWLILIGLAGCLFGTGRFRGLFAIVLFVDLSIVMLTWEHLGRYAIPIRPLVHVGYGLAIAGIIHRVLGKKAKTTE